MNADELMDENKKKINKPTTSKVLYNITGYKDVDQFSWLFSAIYNNHDSFLVHVDEKAPEAIHRGYRAVTGYRANVDFLPSLSITWGGCGLIDAELLAINFALKNDFSWTHLVNLSAQDYPLISPTALRDQLRDSWPSNFVLCNPIKQVHWRIRKRPLFRYLERRGRRYFTPIPKIAPRGINICWVGPWWHILTREFCCWFVASETARRYLAFLRSAGMPDEMLIQNVIKDSPYADQLISSCQHEIIWRSPDDPVSASARPNILTINDLPRLEASDAFFARKFDHKVDCEVLDWLAARLQVATP